MSILTLSGVSKSFNDTHVLRDLSLAVPENSVFGFIGRNGAGKTTAMKIILGLLRPDAGTITVCDETVRYGNTPTNQHIGYLPDVPAFYDYMTPREYLRFTGSIAGLSTPVIAERTEKLLTLTGLGNLKKNRRISGFSRGMKQRLGIAQALLGKPALLICDEPTSALDPQGRREILDILSAARETTTILLSTHILSDVERICDSVAVLHEGKCALEGSLSTLREQHPHDTIRIRLLNADDIAPFRQLLQSATTIRRVKESEADGFDLHTANPKETVLELLHLLADHDIPTASLEILEPTLENLFLEVTQQ